MRRAALTLALVGIAGAARADGELEDPAIARAAGPVVRLEPRASGGAMRSRVAGALAGKTIYVSAGHGWVWTDTLARFATQRGATHGLVEDLISAETVSQELIGELERMGAFVVPVRESDPQAAMAIVDDDAAMLTGIVATPVTAGWAPGADPIVDDRDPFTAGGSQVAPATGGGIATWTFAVPVDGDYTVYVAWVADPSRAPDAHYVIHHAGGDADVRVDQRHHGGTWVRLGRYPFRAGRDASRGAISLIADSTSGTLSLDAVRIGGGTGHVARGPMLVASGRPAYEDCARYAAQWNGAPASVWNYSTSGDQQDDVGARSRFAAWDHPDGEDAVYVAWHTNAPAPARGTSSFAYGPSAYGDVSEFTGVPGSLALMHAIHTQLIDDLRAGWDPAWRDVGEHTAYFGEVNPANNPETPATLIEVAFHDTLEDADALREPRFRRLAARAMARGVARYFAERDHLPVAFPPEPPTALGIAREAATVAVTWAPVVDATGYRVYLSRDGRAFDDGHDITGTSIALDLASGPQFARVAAVNAGGESRRSAVVGAGGVASPAQVLVVDGYGALDSGLLFHEDLTAFDLGTIDRAWEDRINDGSYGARHGLAIAAAGRSFDLVDRDALVTLGDHAALDWLAGRDPGPWTAAERAAIDAFVAGGGRVIASGTDLARASDTRSLGAAFATESTYRAATGLGIFAGLALEFGGTGWGDYDPAAPDTLTPVDGAVAALRAPDGAIAATWRPDRGLVLGAPFETIAGAETRAEVMRRALDGLGVPAEATLVDDGCGCRTTDTSGAVGLALAVLVIRAPRRRRRA